MNDDPSALGPDDEQGSVFGKLPASRPGTRSPRRDSTTKRAGGGESSSAPGGSAKPPRGSAKPPGGSARSPRASAKPVAGERATASRPARKPPAARPGAPKAAREPAAEPADEQSEESDRGLDDLAWAGVAAVAEAATFGVRLANRALGALRDGVERR